MFGPILEFTVEGLANIQMSHHQDRTMVKQQTGHSTRCNQGGKKPRCSNFLGCHKKMVRNTVSAWGLWAKILMLLVGRKESCDMTACDYSRIVDWILVMSECSKAI